ncbi:MAG: hypothetical protein A2359_05155 [Candidatus Moranbacteria bacterium RIFOXYB1_FULL_43_19]|nr:MAG: hypothetical protein A2359_05155 [Candidatus Moranbacteria bacterium RIFOXYB1_FULL_43_19]OGI28118.1 MAG: hypothetical protein A2184_02435 [Candidatus Moranbacteria bacterium RIFOXYA1_FULL_44_7]OGI34128.1 MAG: hypothetical protein A2420_04315 [Candidatus Moranbacteria bacterium RIFOXYC1_FULL_44_13]OGI37975.1 MAG: hypothetical protein A2612_01970 [Candidatus Moranbacteria bacterium RIFOXYD1_FULL_44_12]
MDLISHALRIIGDYWDMREFSNFLLIFSVSLIIVIGVIAFLESIVALWNSESSQTIVKKTLTTLFYSIVLTTSGFFWLNFIWQNVTGSILTFDIPAQDAYCFLFICRQ